MSLNRCDQSVRILTILTVLTDLVRIRTYSDIRTHSQAWIHYLVLCTVEYSVCIETDKTDEGDGQWTYRWKYRQTTVF